MTIQRVISILAIFILFSTSEGFAESHTIPVSNQCLSKNSNYLEGLQRFNCVEIEVYEIEAAEESYPKADFYINIQDAHPNTYGKSARCPNARIAIEKITKKCVINSLEAREMNKLSREVG